MRPMLFLLLFLLAGCPEMHKSTIPVKSFSPETTLFMEPSVTVWEDHSAHLGSASAQATGNGISVIFHNATAELNSESAPLTIHWKGKMEFPINPDQMGAIKYTANGPHYFLFKDKDATVSLEFTFAGKTFTEHFTSTMEINEDVNKLYMVPISPNKQTNYVVDYTLKIERSTPKALVRFTWDSLDVGGFTGNEKYPDMPQ